MLSKTNLPPDSVDKSWDMFGVKTPKVMATGLYAAD
jgi:hypothetical protein